MYYKMFLWTFFLTFSFFFTFSLAKGIRKYNASKTV